MTEETIKELIINDIRQRFAKHIVNGPHSYAGIASRPNSLELRSPTNSVALFFQRENVVIAVFDSVLGSDNSSYTISISDPNLFETIYEKLQKVMMIKYVDGIFYSAPPEFNELHVEYMLEHLLGLDWETKRTARHEYFMSETPRTYSYGNRAAGDTEYHSKPFTETIDSLRMTLNQQLGAEFNVCFMNKYDDQHQHLGWHADDFEGMRSDQPIAVCSYGAEREIWVKPKDQKGVVPANQRFLLQNGSLFVMAPGYQDTHFHKIPKHDKPCGCRISLTFRSFR